jgi:hypothetical protein
MVTKVNAEGKMLVWCGILFGLGIMAFMDSLFNYGEIFRQVNSVLFMLVSLGLLVRTTTKIRRAAVEKQVDRLNALEAELSDLRQGEIERRRTERQPRVSA